jgi:hypothetical protein
MQALVRRWSRSRLPAAIAEHLDLGLGERILAEAEGSKGQWLVGTERALYLCDEESSRRLPWEQVERAEWKSETATVAIVEVSGWGQPETRTEVELAERGRLMELLRERVTKSVVVQVYASVYGRRGLTVVGRRTPSGEGEVQWSYVLAEGLDPADPLVDAVAQRTLIEAQTELGWL